MKKTLALILALVMVLALCACGNQAAPTPAPAAPEAPAPEAEGNEPAAAETPEYPKMTIILAHAAPVDDSRHLGALAIEQYLEEKSGGNIQVDVYPASQLGDVNSMTESCQNGSAQMVILPPANLVGFQPLLGVLDVPYFLPGNLDDARIVMDGPAGDALLECLRDVNMVGLDWWDSQFKEFTSNVPLHSTADFKGLKFRVMPSEVLLQMIKSLGGSAVTFDYSEVFNGLQTGAIDGQEASLASIYNMKFHEVQKYVTMTNHIKSEYLLFANKDWYDGLDDATRQLLTEAVAEGGKVNNEEKAKAELAAREAIEADGCQFVELTDEEIQGLSDAARQDCLDLYLAKNGDAGAALVQIFNDEIAKLG